MVCHVLILIVSFSDMIADTSDKMAYADDDEHPKQVASSHRLATDLGVNAYNMQVMKASFFADQDIELELGIYRYIS